MKPWLRTILLIFFSATFLISGYLLLDYYMDSRKQKNQFDNLAQIMHESAAHPHSDLPVYRETDDPDNPETPTEPEGSPLVEVTDPETGECLWVLPDFADLYQMNNHIVGWISIPGTVVDYPVMQTPDSPDYYLYRSFSKEYSRHGCIYVREKCDVLEPSDNVTIYGHRMGDGTMFNTLHDYASEDFYKTHSLVQFNTLNDYHTYKIFAVFRISSSTKMDFPYHRYTDFESEKQFEQFLENCRSRSLYDTGVSVSYGDKLITLSTCEYTLTNGRLVVVAKQIA